MPHHAGRAVLVTRGLNNMNLCCRISVSILLLCLLVLPIGHAAENAPAASPTPLIETAESPAPTATPEPDRQEMLNIENDLNSLKEDIFRSKARTVLLQEFLINTEVDIYLNPISQKHFRIKSILLILDNSEIFKKDYAPGDEPKNRLETKLFFWSDNARAP